MTVYTEQGVRVFSKFHVKDLPESEKGLRGSYITTVESNNRLYYHQPNYLVSYEPSSRRFFVLNFLWNSQLNIFPSLITISTDNSAYRRKTLDSGEFLVELQKQRYSLPWRLNDWEWAYVTILREMD